MYQLIKIDEKKGWITLGEERIRVNMPNTKMPFAIHFLHQCINKYDADVIIDEAEIVAFYDTQTFVEMYLSRWRVDFDVHSPLVEENMDKILQYIIKHIDAKLLLTNININDYKKDTTLLLGKSDAEIIPIYSHAIAAKQLDINEYLLFIEKLNSQIIKMFDKYKFLYIKNKAWQLLDDHHCIKLFFERNKNLIHANQ